MTRLARLAEAYGVSTDYEPHPGHLLQVPGDTVVAVLGALGVDATTPQAVRAALDARLAATTAQLLPSTVVSREGSPQLTPGPAPLPEGTVLRVETESGEVRDWGVDLPLGVHRLRAYAPDGRAAHASLLVVPDRLPAPASRSAGLLVQLYSVLSRRSWGMGDLGDLAELVDWAGRRAGTGFVQVNPLHQAVPPAPGEASDASPYRPSSRLFPDPVYLCVPQIPEYGQLVGADRERAERLLTQAAGLREAVLGPSGQVDRDAVWALKRSALELLHRVKPAPARAEAYADFVAGRGQALEDHATWNLLADLHGPDWNSWPPGLEDPRSPRIARIRSEHPHAMDFHRWVAWLTDTQLADAQRTAREAGMSIGLIQDLAVGVHPSGADTWAWQGLFAQGMSIGAPPDAFNAAGQDWSLPPWRPDVLHDLGYAPYRELLRAQLRHSGGLRVDHVMGHFRQWWVPSGSSPADGTYVRYDAGAMLGLLTLEASRTGALVIGEDLGTVAPGVREELAERGVLGTSVLWFEREHGTDEAAAGDEVADSDTTASPLPPEKWRAGALATVTTHDLPSTAARLSGDHIRLRRELGLLSGSSARLAAEAEGDAEVTHAWLRLCTERGLPGAGTEAERVAALYRLLARTPAALVGIWLPDGVGDRRPQNVPGTRNEYPNWRLPIADGSGRALTLEQLTEHPRLRGLLHSVREELARQAGGGGDRSAAVAGSLGDPGRTAADGVR